MSKKGGEKARGRNKGRGKKRKGRGKKAQEG